MRGLWGLAILLVVFYSFRMNIQTIAPRKRVVLKLGSRLLTGGSKTLDPARLAALRQTQARILARAAGLVRPGGAIAYATCSLLEGENGERVADFLAAHPHWSLDFERRFTPLEGGDGFYIARLTREA